MGNKYDHAEISHAASGIQTTINELRPAIESLNTAAETLTDEIGYSLQGAAYEKLKSNVEEYILPMTQAFGNILDDLESVKATFNTKERDVSAHGSHIDTDALGQSVTSLSAGSKALLELQRVVPVGSGELEMLIELYDKQVKSVSEKIEAVNDFASGTNGIFDQVDTALQALITGLNSLSGGEVHSDGTMTFAGGTAWLGTLNTYNTTANSGSSLTGPITRPKGMSDADYQTYKAEMLAEAKQLHDEGWSKAAIRKGFVKQVEAMNKAYGGANGVNWERYIYQQAHVIGSETFTKMVDVAYTNTSKGARATLDMVYDVLGAKLDDYHFMQLGNVANELYSFPTDPNEVAEFVEFVTKFSDTMQQAHPASKGDLNQSFDNQIRYWLDKPVIDMINTQHWSRDQYHAWVTGHDIPHEQWGLSNAQAHNRIPTDLVPKTLTADEKKDKTKVADYEKRQKESYPSQKASLAENGRNYKDQVGGKERMGYHVEVVFNSNGGTVSQWNPGVLQYNPDGTVKSNPADYVNEPDYMRIIANTDSANYANKGDRVHDQLDYNPADGKKGLESDLRVVAKNQFVQSSKSVWSDFTSKGE
jgi:hypothetical protein